MIDHALKDHATPHLACTVDRKGRGQQFGIAPDQLRVSIFGKVENPPNRQSDFLRLYRSYDVDGGVVPSIVDSLSKLDQTKNNPDDDGGRGYNFNEDRQ